MKARKLAEYSDAIIGGVIRRRRLLAGLTQPELGTAAGCSYQQIQKYETGVNRVSFSALVKIAKGLRCKASDLVREAEDEVERSTGAG